MKATRIHSILFMALVVMFLTAGPALAQDATAASSKETPQLVDEIEALF